MLTPEQVVEQLRALRAQIPEFVQMSREDVRQIRRSVVVNADLARAAVIAVGASDFVQSAIGNTPDDLRQADDELARWSVVEKEFQAMHRGVSLANLIRRKRIHQVVQHAYNLSRDLARAEGHTELLPHVEAMSRIRKSRRRRAKAGEPAAPQPQPPSSVS
jgi:hypothetical protein